MDRNPTRTPNAVVQEAINAAGSQNKLAQALGVGQGLVWSWLWKSKDGISHRRVLDVERVTGISRHRLRPDLYPAPTLDAAE